MLQVNDFMIALQCFPYTGENKYKYRLRYKDKCNRYYDLVPYQITSDGIDTIIMLKCIEVKSNPITYSYQKILDAFDGFSKLKFYNQQCNRLDVKGVSLENNCIIVNFR